MNPKNLLFIFVAALAILACGRTADEVPEPPLDPDKGKSYFFLEEGKYREYNVFEVRYQATDNDTFRYQIREEIGESFVSGGNTSHLVNRYRRANSSEQWELDSVWTARIEGDKAVVVENNVPVVKMVFPADTSRRWDGNLFNSHAPRIQRLKNFNSTFTVGLNTFLETAEVELSSEDDFFTERDFRREVYRDSIGLIFKEYVVVGFCADPDESCYGQRVVTSGRLYREELYAHGYVDED